MRSDISTVTVALLAAVALAGTASPAAPSHRRAVTTAASAKRCVDRAIAAFHAIEGADTPLPFDVVDEYRHKCGAATPAVPRQPASKDAFYDFSGQCSVYEVNGQAYLRPGPCRDAIELSLPVRGAGKPVLLGLHPAGPSAPIVTLQLEAAHQGNVNNDVMQFSASPLMGVAPGSGLTCTFVKSPADASASARPNEQPMATLNCISAQLHFGFLAAPTDIARMRKAFLDAYNRLTPGRPFVSPTPDPAR